MKGILVALCIVALAASVRAEQGPYEDIQGLLRSAAGAADGLASLDAPGPPRIIEVQHNHHHLVAQGVPRHVAQQIAEDNTPPPPHVRIVAVPNRAQARRHAAEDAAYAATAATPHVTSLNIKSTVNVVAPSSADQGAFTLKGQRGDTRADEAWKVKGSGFSFPLVDRRLKRPKFAVIADTDGSEKGAGGEWKPHTAAELQAEALKLLSRAKVIQAKREERDAMRSQQLKDDASMGLFHPSDQGFEDELTRLQRVSARMNRLLEQMEREHPQDSFEASIARKKYFLKIYRTLKRDATTIIEAYALRTGNSIFSLFGDGKIDPSIAAFLPPNSVAAILAQYANPTQTREDETPRDVISGTDAKRIQYSIDYYKAKSEGTKLPMPPKIADTDEQAAEKRRHNNPLLNKVVASQEGEFGQGRPAITTGTQAIGRSSVHVSVVNPTETAAVRGQPFQINLKHKAGGKKF